MKYLRKEVLLISLLHRFDCGCVGFLIEGHNGDDRALLVDHCDKTQDDHFGYSLFYRDMPNKTSKLLTQEEEEKIVRELSALIAEGYAMRDLAQTIDSIRNRK